MAMRVQREAKATPVELGFGNETRADRLNPAHVIGVGVNHVAGGRA